jgi:Spy/CpxP family protein refolding chaperone
MRSARLLLAIVLLAGMVTPAVVGQDKAKVKEKETPGKMRGQLPPNYGKLGLSDEQKQKIYVIRDKFRVKLEELQKEINDLREQERKDMEKVLTSAQRDRLREIIAGKGPSDDKSGK